MPILPHKRSVKMKPQGVLGKEAAWEERSKGMPCTTLLKHFQGSKKLCKEESGQEVSEEKRGLLQPVTAENPQAMYSE